MARTARTALIIVDVQNDFLPGGTLAVPEGDHVIAPINALLQQPWDLVVATKDWHPTQHCSFTENGGPWPAHCIAGTKGAELPASLNTGPIHHIVHKGLDVNCDSYSAFFDNNHARSTGLSGLLKGLEIQQLHICGLALDFCVKATIEDALACGFEVTLHTNATQGITNTATTFLAALAEKGVHLR